MRDVEYITCPNCRRIIAAYVPSRGDGTAVRIMRHKTLPSGRSHHRRVTTPECRGSGRLGRYSRPRREWEDM